jgi:hypothetical protein
MGAPIFNFGFQVDNNTVTFDASKEKEYAVKRLIESREFDEFSADSHAQSIIDEGVFSKEELDLKLNNIIASKSRGSKKNNPNQVTNKNVASIFASNSKQTKDSASLIEQELKEDFFVFLPSKKSMKTEYPELDDVVEFKDLSNRELVFVWWYANQTSPYFDMKDIKHKTALCIKESFGSKLSKDDIDSFIEGNFPEKISIAIQRMKRFNPSVRMKAKMMNEKILTDYMQMLSKNVADMDTKDAKAYVDVTKIISQNLNDLVSDIENSFGIKIKNGKISSEDNEMDIILSSEQKVDYDL